MSTGKISNRPINIAKVKIILEKWLYKSNDPYGPTDSSPGPILERQEIVAEKFETKPWVTSFPATSIIVPLIGSQDKIKIIIKVKKKYKVIKAKTSWIVVSSRVLPSNLVLDIYLGLINLRILVKIPLKPITNLDILIPPPVEPAIAPDIIKIRIIHLESSGQYS